MSKTKSIPASSTKSFNFKNISLLDDAWFTTSLDNNLKLASFILNIVLNKNDLVVTKITTQKKLTNINNKSVVLDALAIDSNKKQYNIEIQKANTPNIILRSRFHLSLLDAYNLKKSNDFNKLPETYIIFFCNFDLFKEGEASYVVERYVNGKKLFNDLEHLIFINCKYNDLNSSIGKLIHDMKSSIYDKKCYNIFIENEEKGDSKMGEQCNMIRQEGIKIGRERTVSSLIIAMLKENLSIDLISKITKKSEKTILKIKEKNNL